MDVSRVEHPDAATLDALARLQLEACRRGLRIRLVNAPPALVELLELAGLSVVLGLSGCRCGEARREAEQREESVRVEEERDA